MAKDINIQVFRGTETKMSVKEHDGGKCHFLYLPKTAMFPLLYVHIMLWKSSYELENPVYGT